MTSRRMVDLGGCGRIPADALFELYLETRDGDMLTLYQTRSPVTLGSWVYDGAAVLARYIEAFVIHKGDDLMEMTGKSVVELGAGTGIVGVMMGHYGADVTITDLEPLVPLIQYNVEQNKQFLKGSVSTETLCWGDDIREGFRKDCDFIILANCVYYEGSLELLAQTVLELSNKDTVIYACYEERTKEIKTLISKWHTVIGEHFLIADIPVDYYRSLGELDCVRIVRMNRK